MKTRTHLKRFVGQTLTLTSQYCYKDDKGHRGHLVKYVQDQDGNNLAQHLWIKTRFKITPRHGDIIMMTGDVHKYGRMGRKTFGQEDYGLTNVLAKVVVPVL